MWQNHVFCLWQHLCASSDLVCFGTVFLQRCFSTVGISHSLFFFSIHWLQCHQLHPLLCWLHWRGGVALRTSTEVHCCFCSVVLKNDASTTITHLQEVGSPLALVRAWKCTFFVSSLELQPLHQKWGCRWYVHCLLSCWKHQPQACLLLLYITEPGLPVLPVL